MKKLLLSAVLLMSAVVAIAQMPQDKGYKLLFEDNFDGDTLNTKNWYYRTDHRTGGGYMDGWNRKENVRVKDGILYIDCRHEMLNGKMENTGGGVITLKNFGYGYYECKSKPFMAGRGVHTSFWQTGGTNPRVFEIDSHEIDSKSDLGCNNLYVDFGTKDKRVPWPHRAQVPFKTDADGWWVDAYEYTPEGIRFFDNGKEVAFCEWPELTAAQAVWLTALNGCGTVDVDALPGYSAFDYFRFYAKDYPGVNILPNGNFEFNQDKVNPYNPVCWNVTGSQKVAKVTLGEAARDKYKIRFNADEAYNTELNQTLSYIMDGDYVFSAKTRGNGAKVILQSSSKEGNSLLHISDMQWRRIQILVTVSKNEVTLAVNVSGDSQQWLEIDDVEFMKPLLKGQKAPEKKPVEFFGEAVWTLGMAHPVHFTGDAKFFFFDRFVGLGDQITVSMNVTADRAANMTPIARVPKIGKSGWTIQLTEDGGVIFRIGSIADHVDVYAPKAYVAGKKTNINCIFDKGTVSIYSNGKLLKTQGGITHDTNDETAAGRLGTVGLAYEAVSDVIQDMGVKDVETRERMNFRGIVEQLQIYNKVKRP